MFFVSLLNILQSLIYKYIFQVKGGAMEGSAQKFNFSPTSVIWGYMNEVCKVKEVSKFQKEMASPITSFRALLDLWLLKEDKWRSSNETLLLCCRQYAVWNMLLLYLLQILGKNSWKPSSSQPFRRCIYTVLTSTCNSQMAAKGQGSSEEPWQCDRCIQTQGTKVSTYK